MFGIIAVLLRAHLSRCFHRSHSSGDSLCSKDTRLKALAHRENDVWRYAFFGAVRKWLRSQVRRITQYPLPEGLPNCIKDQEVAKLSFNHPLENTADCA